MRWFSQLNCSKALLLAAAVLAAAFLECGAKPSKGSITSEQSHSECSDVGFDEAMAKGIRKSKAGERAASAACFSRAFSLNQNNLGAALYHGEALIRGGQLETSVEVLRRAVSIDPAATMAHLLLASAAQQLGKSALASASYQAALKLEPNNLAALVNYGIIERELGHDEAALDAFTKASQVKPDSPEALYNMADMLYQQNRMEEALTACSAALASRPSFPQASVLRVLVLEASGQIHAAVSAATQGLQLHPGHFSLIYQSARMLRAASRFVESEELFKACTEGEAAGGQPPHAVAYAHNEYGHLLSQLGRTDAAFRQWRRSVEVDPSFAQGWVNMAGQNLSLEESIAAYEKALQLNPSLVEAWINVGQVYYNNFRRKEGYMDQALQAFQKALDVDPKSSYSIAGTSIDLCRFEKRNEDFQEVATRILQDAERGVLLTTSISLVYLLLYPIPDHVIEVAYASKAALVQATADGVVRALPPVQAASATRHPALPASGILTVGYLSADFKEHPVSLLFQSIPGLHDRASFRVVCFSLLEGGHSSEDKTRARIVDGADEFVEIGGLSLPDAVAEVAKHNISLLVEMGGYTQHSRPELVAVFSAIPSVSLLGFAHSLRGSFISAVATDIISSPPEFESRYTEKILGLPRTFYPTDHATSWHTRHLLDADAIPAFTKEQVGLDASAFVFASFNQPNKIGPEMFACWMRILHRVPGSQLWLLKLNEGQSAELNLRREAKRLGIDAHKRLFFTGSADLGDHVGYKSAADLLLDTDLYNAHSTAADALFAGVPIVTFAGTRMVGRIASSIVGGVGLREVSVARNMQDYEEIAVRLGSSPPKAAALKRHLASVRRYCALYSTGRWVEGWERGLKMLWETREPGNHVKRRDVGAKARYHLIVADWL